MLTRYWIEFKSDGNNKIPTGFGYGCGVTAYDYADALKIIKTKVFKNSSFLKLKLKKKMWT